MSKAIRNEYAEVGVEAYYAQNGDTYENPHEAQIHKLIKRNAMKFNCTSVLDLACGGGEVTLALMEIKTENIIGCDPYTNRLYEKLTQKKCFTFSFDDLVRGKHLDTWYEKQFSVIICSFAMHLQPEKKLFPLVSALFFLTDKLVVITPHKRPVLEVLENVELIDSDFELTARGKKVFLKVYSITHQSYSLSL